MEVKIWPIVQKDIFDGLILDYFFSNFPIICKIGKQIIAGENEFKIIIGYLKLSWLVHYLNRNPNHL